MRAETAASIRPIVRSYLIVVTCYYAFDAVFYRVPGDPGFIQVAAVAIMAACLGLFVYTRNTQDMRRLEIAGHVANLMLYGEAMLDISLQYEETKLIYFALLLPVFAVSGAGLTVILPGAIACVVTLCLVAAQHVPSQVDDYVWIALTALVTALGMSGVMRMTIMRAVRARVTADRHRDEASALANFDVLTGLPNRRNFFDVLGSAIDAGLSFDLALVDLDGFKPINDIYGHAAGDAVLIEVGRRLKAVCGEEAFVARLGGDEFALILRNMLDTDLAKHGEEICDRLRLPFNLGMASASLSGSVGFVRCGSVETRGLNGSQLLERADYALYHAKEHQRGTVVLFDCRHEHEMHDFNRVDQALRAGNLRQELCVVFQPQIDLLRRRTVGFEALARWNNPQLGRVNPDVFIRAAERSGLITDLTPFLLEKALAPAVDWPHDLRIAFNLSVRDLHSPKSIARIRDIVTASGVDPHRIEFEITETAMMTDFDQALEGLNALKALGVRIALDDFGSGYSSFSSLHRLPVDVLKIDRSFVTQLAHTPQARQVVKTMLDLCANLGLDHVVEGVETAEELHILREVRARYVQGYMFARPMAPEEVAGFLAAENAADIELRAAG